MSVDNMEDVWAELATVIDMVENDEIAGKLQQVLDYLYMVEERL
jgi:hypothetical protein